MTAASRRALAMASALLAISLAGCSGGAATIEPVGSSDASGHSGITTESFTVVVEIDDAAAAALGYGDVDSLVEARAPLAFGCDSYEEGDDSVSLFYPEGSHVEALASVDDGIARIEGMFADANPGCSLEVSDGYDRITVTAGDEAPDEAPDEASTESVVGELSGMCALGQLLSHPGDPSVSLTYVAADGTESTVY